MLTPEQIQAVNYITTERVDYDVHELDQESILEFARAIEAATLATVTPLVQQMLEAMRSCVWLTDREIVEQNFDEDKVDDACKAARAFLSGATKESSNATKPRPDDQGPAQDGRPDTSATGRKSGAGADEYHEHRAGQPDPDGTHDDRDSGGTGVHGTCDVSPEEKLKYSLCYCTGFAHRIGGRVCKVGAALAALPTTPSCTAQPAQAGADRAGDPAPRVPMFYTVFCLADHQGAPLALPQYSHQHESGVLDLVLAGARREGFQGTAVERMAELGWRVGPVFA